MILLFRFSSINAASQPYNTYPTFATAREHFVHTIGAFTALREADPDNGYSDYLSSKVLTSTERNTLRHFIRDYVQFHKEKRYTDAPRLIFRPLGTGIGDRMGCLMFAYWTAVITRRVFLVDWQDPYPLSEFLEETNDLNILLSKEYTMRALRRGTTVFLNASEESLLLYEHVLSSSTDTVMMATNKVPLNLSDNFIGKYLPLAVTSSNALGIRVNPNFHRSILHHVFTLSNSIRGDQQLMNSKMNLCGKTMRGRRLDEEGPASFFNGFIQPRRPYIAVHARIGRGVGEYPTGRFKDVSENMKAAALCLASRAVRLAYMSGNPALPIYLATDTAEFRNIFEKAATKISHNRVQILSGEWKVIHSTKLTKQQNANITGSGEEIFREAMWGSYMDLVMLGHAEHIVALYSSFPRLALAIGNSETLIELKNDICITEESWR